MKFAKLASAMGALAALMFVGCGQSGGDTRPPASVTGGSLETGANINGLIVDDTHKQYMCIRYDILFQAPQATTWEKSKDSLWKCGGYGVETVPGGYNTCKYTGGSQQQGYRYFVEYEIAFCDDLASNPTQVGSPCANEARPVMRSRAAAKGTCPTDFSNAYAVAKVQFDNKGPWGGGLEPQVDVEEVCWNYKLDIDIACAQGVDSERCVRFGLLMGPPHCGNVPDERPSSYCMLGHEQNDHAFMVVDAGETAIDPILRYLLTDQHQNHNWAEFYLAFQDGVGDRTGLEVIQAPWLLYVNSTGILSDWNNLADRIINFNRGVSGSSSGFPASYRTVGSWHWSAGDAATVGFITNGFPSDSQGSPPPGINTTFLVWDASAVCDVPSSTSDPTGRTIPADAFLARWNNPHMFNGNCAATDDNPNDDILPTSVIKGVIATPGTDENFPDSTFDIIYACVMPSWLGNSGEVLAGANITQLYKISCEASGAKYNGFICNCLYNEPGWYAGNACTPNFELDP